MFFKILKILGIVLVVISAISVSRSYIDGGEMSEQQQGELTGYLLFMILGFVLFYIGNKRSRMPY